MTVSTQTYAAGSTLTWDMTNPASDANLLAGRQSVGVDNETTDRFIDIILGGAFTLHASTAAIGVIEVYGYGSWDGGSAFTADCTGSDGDLTLTATVKSLLHLITIIEVAAVNSEVYSWGPYSLAQVFGGKIPSDWGLWGVHNSGGALAASVTEWQGVKIDFS